MFEVILYYLFFKVVINCRPKLLIVMNARYRKAKHTAAEVLQHLQPQELNDSCDEEEFQLQDSEYCLQESAQNGFQIVS